MAKNAADLLYEFFTAKNRGAYSFSQIWGAIAETEAYIDAWDALGQPVSALRTALDAWKDEVRLSLNGSLKLRNAAGSITEGDVGMLQWASEKMQNTVPEFTETQLDGVREFLKQAKENLVADLSLPDDLKLHIARLIRHVDECLDSWDITGDFTLVDALDRLFGAIRIAEAKSTTPEKWATFWSSYGQPVAVGLIVAAPSLGVGVAQLLGIGA
jgi:hypothetical protein